MVYAAGGSGFGEAGGVFSLPKLEASKLGEARDLFNVPEAADVWERVLFGTEAIKSRVIFFMARSSLRFQFALKLMWRGIEWQT